MEEPIPFEEVTAEEFVKRLNIAGKRGHAFVRNLSVNQGAVWITDKNIDFDGPIQIIECKFATSLFFSNLTKAEAIVVQKCIANYFHFINVQLSFTNRTIHSGTLIITESIARLETLIDNCDISKGVEITDNSTLTQLKITNSVFSAPNGQILVANSKILKDVVLSHCTIEFIIHFDSSIINDRTIIENISCKKMIFNKSQHMSFVGINTIDIKENISFLGAIIEGEVTLQKIKASESNQKNLSSLYFSNFSTFKKTCKLFIAPDEDVPFQVISIDNTSFGDGFDCIGRGGEKNSRINRLHINCSRNVSGNLRFEAIEIPNLSLMGINTDASIIFSHVLFQTVKLSDFTNLGMLQFVHVGTISNETSHFIIARADLGKTQFSNVSFTDFTMSINDSDITNILSSSVKWFHYKQLNENIHTQENYLQKREIFRQLKFAMEKQGDRIQSLVFKQYEMIAYRQEVHASKGRWDERFIMLVNRSNSYGQNWWKPILWAIGITVLFYYFITIAQSPDINGIQLSGVGASRLGNVLWKNFGVFFQMLNPVHLIEKINEGAQEISKMTYFLDYLYRIILSYLIFQTISAFRKYVK
jgi:hypothetical protein